MHGSGIPGAPVELACSLGALAVPDSCAVPPLLIPNLPSNPVQWSERKPFYQSSPPASQLGRDRSWAHSLHADDEQEDGGGACGGGGGADCWQGCSSSCTASTCCSCCPCGDAPAAL